MLKWTTIRSHKHHPDNQKLRILRYIINLQLLNNGNDVKVTWTGSLQSALLCASVYGKLENLLPEHQVFQYKSRKDSSQPRENKERNKPKTPKSIENNWGICCMLWFTERVIIITKAKYTGRQVASSAEKLLNIQDQELKKVRSVASQEMLAKEWTLFSWSHHSPESPILLIPVNTHRTIQRSIDIIPSLVTFLLSPALEPKEVRRENGNQCSQLLKKVLLSISSPFPTSGFSAQPLYSIFCFPFFFLSHTQLSFTFSTKYPHSILWTLEFFSYLQFSFAPSPIPLPRPLAPLIPHLLTTHFPWLPGSHHSRLLYPVFFYFTSLTFPQPFIFLFHISFLFPVF